MLKSNLTTKIRRHKEVVNTYIASLNELYTHNDQDY